MDTSRRASGYDLFKLIVAIILLSLFFLFLNRPNPAQVPVTAASVIVQLTRIAPATASLMPATNPVAALATSTSPIETSTSISLPSATDTKEPVQTETPRAALSATPLPSPTGTNPNAPTATAIPAPTGAPIIESTPLPTETTSSTVTACEAAASHSRLQPGMNATITRRLNFRSSPGIRDNWLRTNIPGTRVEIVGGPECVPHNEGAYIWWEIKLPDGEIGWSAEAPIHGTFYFMEPTNLSNTASRSD